MSILESTKDAQATLVLLPKPHFVKHPPARPEPSKITVEWPSQQLKLLHSSICPSQLQWDAELAKNTGRITASEKAKRRSEAVEAGMYI